MAEAVRGLSDFIITEKLGSGTYATVYKAYRKRNKREVVAVKSVVKSKLNKTSSENLLTEIGILKKLKHPFIVELKDFQWDEQCIYLIMEYCSGGDLSCFIRTNRRLSENIVKKFLQQLAQALQFLRKNNLTHMDLKPQNILLSSRENPILKLADFGFAQYLNQDENADTLRGSPLYMAPEILLQYRYDAKVDLWSVGVILYECLFGKAPFSSSSFADLIEKIKDTRPIQIPYGVEISSDCSDLLQKLLKRNPEERIGFDEFFQHPFVDMEHAPSADSLDKAIEIVKVAVNLDNEKQFSEAIKKYCESLEYFIPAINYEVNPDKKNALRKKVQEYLDRTEELKKLFKPNIITLDTMEELTSLAAEDGLLLAALTLAEAAEALEKQEKYVSSIEKYEKSLSVLIPLLAKEPRGRRKDLLHKKVELWLSHAEEIKNFLRVNIYNSAVNNIDPGTSCAIQ